MRRLIPLLLILPLVPTGSALTQEKKAPIEPTFAKVAYGEHERQVLDFWQAKSDKPTPVVVFIHGGSWKTGDKSSAWGSLKTLLDAGISVASINYRYVQIGVEQKVEPPVKAPLDDAARALQFVRSKSKEWNLDKTRVGLTGGSAGACSSLWLSFHDDLADPKSKDPVARESTRVTCAAVTGAQTSLDPKELKEWLPNYTYGAHAFGLKDFKELSEKRESVLKWIKEYSPIEHVTKDDPPICLVYGGKEVPVLGKELPDPTHSGVMGMKLEEKLKSVGVDCVLIHAGRTNDRYKGTVDYLIDRLKK